MQIIENKALLLKLKDPSKVTQFIPKSKQVGDHEVLVHWGLDEVKLLRNLGIKKAPSPITTRYTWPGRFKPFKHQKETSSFLTLHKKAFVLNEAGTGKSFSALWAADYLMNMGLVRRVLIIGPVSILYDAWFNSIQSTIIHRSAVVAYNTDAAKRIRAVQSDAEIVITNIDGVKILRDAIVKDGRFDLVIVDECNFVKNVSTHRWKSLNSIIGPETRLWMMTGTPASQSPEDAYGLAKLVNPSAVPPSATAWKFKVMDKITNFKWVPKKDAKDRVFEVLQPAIRFEKKDCLDLPPVLTVTRHCEMTPQQTKYYKMLKDRMVIEAAGTTVSAVHAAAAITKMLQIAAGSVRDDNQGVVEFDCSSRLEVLREIIAETDRKVLVFAPFTSSIETILSDLHKHHIEAGRIDGSVSLKDRQILIDQFQRSEQMQVLVIQPQAAAHGITLTAADTVVFYGPVTSVELYIQCIARADRAGQNSDKVTVVHIESSEVERRMFKVLEGRVNDHTAIVDLYKSLADV